VSGTQGIPHPFSKVVSRPPTFRPVTVMSHPQDEVQAHSLDDPESFWLQQASHLHWHKPPLAALHKTTKTLAGDGDISHPHWEWFPGGEISTCHNCVDRHVEAGHGAQPAIFYDSPVTGTEQAITYAQLLDEVETFAGVLREEGVKRGDVVLVYSEPPFPLSPLPAFLLSTSFPSLSPGLPHIPSDWQQS